jgi:anti-sigma B factor antagonist
LEFKVEEHPGQRAVVRLTGRLDANSSDALKTALKEVAATGLAHLVVDMQAVSFIDSSGLSALVSGYRAVREQDGALLLARVGPQIKVALELSRLYRVFPVYDDVASALASFDKLVEADGSQTLQ